MRTHSAALSLRFDLSQHSKLKIRLELSCGQKCDINVGGPKVNCPRQQNIRESAKSELYASEYLKTSPKNQDFSTKIRNLKSWNPVKLLNSWNSIELLSIPATLFSRFNDAPEPKTWIDPTNEQEKTTPIEKRFSFEKYDVIRRKWKFRFKAALGPAAKALWKSVGKYRELCLALSFGGFIIAPRRFVSAIGKDSVFQAVKVGTRLPREWPFSVVVFVFRAMSKIRE